MGPGIVILIWAFVFGIIGIIWLGLVALSILGWWKKNRWLKWGAGIPAGLMALTSLVIAGLILYFIIRSTIPSYVFDDTFGESARENVSAIESKVFSFADSGSVHLRFNTSKSGFTALILDDLLPVSTDEFRRSIGYQSPSSQPEWWTLSIEPEWTYYLRKNNDRSAPGKNGFYYEIEFMAFDPSTQTGYYRFLGID